LYHLIGYDDAMATVSGGIGARVRAARERLGWTREALAFHAEVSWSAVAQVETGRRTNLRPSTLAALSRALGVSIDYLVDGGLSRPTMLVHSAFCYRTDEQFRTIAGPFLAEGVERSEATLAVTSAANIELLREYLGKQAQSVEFVDASTWYSSPIAALEGYKSYADAKLDAGAHWVRLVGQPAWTARSDAQVLLWTRYESLLNLVFSASPLTAVCAYDERSVAPEIVAQAHLTHPHTFGDAGTSPNPGYADPGHFAFEP
jgi:transcriptional regulator with XRE-family HTH domain